jgi:hypothetical protein
MMMMMMRVPMPMYMDSVYPGGRVANLRRRGTPLPPAPS